MSEVEQLSISNLLSQVTIIKKKYDDLAEYTGENYNIFKVLGIYQDELSHSAIIGDLLNNKGSHGQKDTFLKLFLNEINNFEENTEQFKVLQNFKSDKSTAYIEKHIGKVDYSNGEGGRIDVLINDGFNNIIIENKVWAGDQHQQIERYYNYDKKAIILYLTLDGSLPSDNSKGSLKEGKDFFCVSYKETIKIWLENCILEMANKPIIRESLNQYLVLIKQLTNQTTNNKMKEELIETIFQNENNLEAFIELKKLNNDFYKYVILNKLIPNLIEISKELGLEVCYSKDALLYQKKWPGFSFTNEKLKRFDINIHVSAFLASSFSDIHFGITSNNKNYDFSIIKDKFDENFKNNKPKNHWKTKVYYEEYSDFNDLKVLGKIYKGKFKNDLKSKIEFVLEIINSSD